MTAQTQNAVSWDSLLDCNRMTKKQAAVRYAQLGLHVVPLHSVGPGGCTCERGLACPSAGKHPISPNWFNDATSDPARVAAVWDSSPDLNIGIAPARSGHVALDLDVKRANGLHFFAGTHEAAGGPAAVTPSGGAHRLFLRCEQTPPNTSNKSLGFDWMSTAGQIVVAPSTTAKGAYRWVAGGAPPRVPQAVLGKLVEAKSMRVQRDDLDYGDAGEPPAYGPDDVIPGVVLNVAKGERSEALYGLAAQLWERGHTAAQVLATLLSTQAGASKADDESGPGWAWRYCVWPAASAVGGYDPVTERAKGAFPGFAPVEQQDVVAPGSQLEDWYPSEQPLDTTIRMLDVSGIEDRQISPPEFLLDGWLPRGIMSALYGVDGIGKTVFMMTQAMLLACEPESDEEYARGMRGVPCLLLLAEDTPQAIQWRLKNIAETLGLPSRRWASRLHIPSLMDADVKWMRYEKDGTPKRTAFAEWTERTIEKLRIVHYGADPISDIYEDRENERDRVAPFLRDQNKLCVTYNLAGLLLGHPAKAEGSTYSGSGAWSSKVRSRLFMRRETISGVDQVIVSQEKTNYGPKMAERRYVFNDKGVLVDADPAKSAVQAEARKEELRGRLLQYMQEATLGGQHVSALRTARNFLPAVMIEQGAAGDATKEELAGVLMDLIRAKVVEDGVALDGTNGRPSLPGTTRGGRVGLWFAINTW